MLGGTSIDDAVFVSPVIVLSHQSVLCYELFFLINISPQYSFQMKLLIL